MSARIYYAATLVCHGVTAGGNTALAATGGGVWATLATIQYMRPGTALPMTDDARQTFGMQVFGLATSGTSWTVRVRDTTNGATIITSPALTAIDTQVFTRGPLSNWPTNAVLEIQYTGGGTGAFYQGILFGMVRT